MLHDLLDIVVGSVVSFALWAFKRHIVTQSDAKKELLARIAVLELQISYLKLHIGEKKD